MAGDPPRQMTLRGRFRLTEPGGPKKTCGKFAGWVTENQGILRKYFKADLFPGSVNVDIDSFDGNLHRQLDRSEPRPAFTIPFRELRDMPLYLRDGQAWPVLLSAARIPDRHPCWVFRRIGSKVDFNVLEIVSTIRIVDTFGVRDGEEMELSFLPFDPQQGEKLSD
jgi:hypothetical protein